MARDEVARNQRSRMYGAMIETVSEHGYANTTVAQVIGLAGVSRRAFYEQFPNKEACFLGTYDIVVARARKRVLDGWESERGWANRLHAAFKALFDDMASAPKGPRLVLLDSLGVGPSTRARMQLAAATFERLVLSVFGAAPDGVPLSPLTARAIVGGSRHVAFTRMFENRETELYAVTDELLDWSESYRSPVAARLATVAATQPRSVEPKAARFLESDSRRARTLGALVHLTLDVGYAELSDPQIAQFAGISTEAFHKLFATKEACFLTVLDEIVAEALESVSSTIDGCSCWPQAVHQAVQALLEYFAAHQALSRLAFIDIFEVGPGMTGRMTRAIEEFTRLLDDSGPELRRGPLVAREAVTGAIWAVLSSYVSNDRVRQLPRLTDQLTFIVLAPYIGAKAAIDAIDAQRSLPSAP
jgi:AcrR family transcriptional regulator